MGFGSGGGFTPSPNNVPGSTQTGTDKDTDLHQFTGSVDITGSLTLNGSSITGGGGGGGGAVSSYTNSGNNRVITSVNSNTINGEANFTFDGSNLVMSDDTDATASFGRVLIGQVAGGTSDYAYFAHRDQATANNYALQQRADGTTLVNAPAGGDISFRIGNVSTAMVINGGENNNIGINNGTPAARLHVSANTNEKDVFRADGDINNILYVSGSGVVGIGTGTPTAALHVSSSDTGDIFRIDHEDHADNPIFVVTGSGRVGIGTATPSAVLDVHPDNAAGSNEVKFRGSNGTSHFYFSSAEHTYIRGGKQTSTVFIADSRNTGGSDNQKCIIGNATSTTAQLHVSSSDNSTVMNVTSNSGSILTALESQRVGVGTSAPTAMLHVSGAASTTDPLFRIDSANQGPEQPLKPVLFVTGSGLVGIGTDAPRTDASGSGAPETNRLHILGEYGADQGQNPVVNTLLMLENNDHVGIQFMFPNQKAGQLTWGTSASNRKATFYYDSNHNVYSFEGTSYGGSRAVQIHAGADGVNIGSSNAAHMAGHTKEACLHISSSTGGADTGGPVLLKIDHANSDNILFVTGSGRVGIGTETPEHTLSVSGSAAFSGAFGSTAVETLTAAGTISATTGLTIIDASSSLAVNNTLNFTIANGTFVGQEKKIRAMIKSGSTGPLSTGIAIGGTNIDSAGDVPVGQIVLSGNLPDKGPLFHRAGCSLIWGGTKWLPVGNFNFNINNTGRSFI